MSLNFSRQTFFAVFVPLTLVAGLFWLSEIRGYKAEMSILVLPKTEFAKGAAKNLAALARGLPFAAAVYEADPTMENPFLGKTSGEREKFWKDTVTIATSGQSDLILLSVHGSDQDEALTLVESVAAELVRTGSRYYNQKTDIDIRIIQEPVTIPSFTEWPRFLAYTLGTALSFTLLFFLVYTLITRLFPKKLSTFSKTAGEYTISPETFKPRMPRYWNGDEKVIPSSVSSASAPRVLEEETTEEAFPEEIMTPAPSLSEEAFASNESDESLEPSSLEEERHDEPVPSQEILEVSQEVVVPTAAPEESESVSETAFPMAQGERAAAPDNLPVFEGPLTPLQGAQARLMKLDIDASAAALSADAEVEELNHTPKTHEPTPEEYKRRLNALLSGKM